jgi:hypothetical protein
VEAVKSGRHDRAGSSYLIDAIRFSYSLGAFSQFRAKPKIRGRNLARSILNEEQQPTATQQEAAKAQEKAAVLPQIPPPTFRLFKSGTNQQTTYVVPTNTSDDQLKSLLWFFRSRVRAGDFKAIGITQPTTTQWGQYGAEGVDQKRATAFWTVPGWTLRRSPDVL